MSGYMGVVPFGLFFFKQKTAYEISACLVGSEMCKRQNWGRDRIQDGGEVGGTVTFIVEEASAVEVPLRQQKEGVEGYFTDEQSERYDMKVKVKIQVRGGDRSTGSVTAHAVHTQTVAEDITLDERERVWFAMTEALMQELNTTLEANIPKYLEKFLLRKSN